MHNPAEGEGPVIPHPHPLQRTLTRTLSQRERDLLLEGPVIRGSKKGRVSLVRTTGTVSEWPTAPSAPSDRR